MMPNRTGALLEEDVHRKNDNDVAISGGQCVVALLLVKRTGLMAIG